MGIDKLLAELQKQEIEALLGQVQWLNDWPAGGLPSCSVHEIPKHLLSLFVPMPSNDVPYPVVFLDNGTSVCLKRHVEGADNGDR